MTWRSPQSPARLLSAPPRRTWQPRSPTRIGCPRAGTGPRRGPGVLRCSAGRARPGLAAPGPLPAPPRRAQARAWPRAGWERGRRWRWCRAGPGRWGPCRCGGWARGSARGRAAAWRQRRLPAPRPLRAAAGPRRPRERRPRALASPLPSLLPPSPLPPSPRRAGPGRSWPLAPLRPAPLPLLPLPARKSLGWLGAGRRPQQGAGGTGAGARPPSPAPIGRAAAWLAKAQAAGPGAQNPALSSADTPARPGPRTHRAPDRAEPKRHSGPTALTSGRALAAWPIRGTWVPPPPGVRPLVPSLVSLNSPLSRLRRSTLCGPRSFLGGWKRRWCLGNNRGPDPIEGKLTNGLKFLANKVSAVYS